MTLIVEEMEDPRPDCLYVASIYTKEQNRGRGNARQALEKLCDAADEQNVWLFLTIRPGDGITYDQLQSFYESLGFEHDHKNIFQREPNADI